MIVFNSKQAFKQMPLRSKIGLFVAITAVLTFLFFFGVTFLIIALCGGVLSFIINLFTGKKSRVTMPQPEVFIQRSQTFHSRRQQHRSRPRPEDDDVIDV